MEKTKLIPAIRFSGFADDWGRRSLGSMGTTYTGLSGKAKEDFGHGDAKFITYMNVFSNPISDPDMIEPIEIDNKQEEVEIGDVFFTTSSETPEEVGMSSVLLKKEGCTYLNSFCFGYRPTVKLNPNYLAFMLRSRDVRKDIVFLAQGISRYNISKNKMMEIEVPIPSIDEQDKIGNYFRSLDSLITLHQRKLEKMRTVKNSLLEKMFPCGESNIPEIRVKGFINPWEQHKLSELASIVTGKLDANAAKEDGTYAFFTCGKETLRTDTYSFDGDAILISGNGDLGFTRKYSGKFDAYQRTYVLQDFSVNFHFLEHAIHRYLPDRISSESFGGAMPYIKLDTLADLVINVPDIEEIKKIIMCLDSIDNLIVHHQRRLELLEIIKKAFLDKMFVKVEV